MGVGVCLHRTPTCGDPGARQLLGVRWHVGEGSRECLRAARDRGQVVAALHADHFLESDLILPPLPPARHRESTPLRLGSAGRVSGKPDAPNSTPFISTLLRLFCVKCAPPPQRDPVSLGWPSCPAVTLTWLPFTVTHSLAETIRTLITPGGVNCPPSCCAA